MVYGVNVKFKQGDSWSSSYTYKSIVYYAKGTAVVVPTGGWYSVGKVVACSENNPFSLATEYKWIIGSIDALKELGESSD